MIYPALARLIIREHLYKPIQGKVLALGRQKIALNYQETLELLSQEGYEPSHEVLQRLPTDIDNITRGAAGNDFISDRIFFGLLGVEDLVTVDVSDYEDAEIVHNLNDPIPDSLCGQFNFIVDGGTFDHLFDLKNAFANVVKLLADDGRIIQWNAASNYIGSAYLSFGPDFFYDYYAANQFADCKVYLAVVDNGSQGEQWDIYEYVPSEIQHRFHTERIVMTLVIAEKGPNSTWDKLPVQVQYRDTELWGPYRAAREKILSSSRKPLAASRGDQRLTGWKYQRKKPDKVADLTTMALKVKDRGVVWAFKRIGARLSKRSDHISNSVKSQITGAKHLEGYRYIGKI